MNIVSTLSDWELLERIPLLVQAERRASAEVIEHLVEIDRRRLFLGQACSSLYSYCLERLGYSEDESHTRVRVARLAESLPAVLDELRSGAIHLTGLFLLSNHLTEDNHEAVLAASRGKSRRALEQLIAAWFPRPDVEQRVTPLPEQPTLGASASATRPEPGNSGRSVALPPRVEPLSPSRYRIEFTASAELAAKIDQARALVSHKLFSDLVDQPPGGDQCCDVHARQGGSRPGGHGVSLQTPSDPDGSVHCSASRVHAFGGPPLPPEPRSGHPVDSAPESSKTASEGARNLLIRINRRRGRRGRRVSRACRVRARRALPLRRA
jgi:hypothetical protein